MTAPDSLLEKWRQAWPAALKVWSPYTRLSEPKWARNKSEARTLGVVGSFACIRINDHSVRISLSQIKDFDLEDYALEILAHEIGHHVFCPANLLEAGKAVALASLALPTLESHAPSIVNMWEDLLINDRLVRYHGQRHAEIYERINRRNKTEPEKLWRLYMRAFEILWGLEPGRLKGTGLKPAEEGDAYLVARMVRVYGKDWMMGVGGFAALCLPYLMGQQKEKTTNSFEVLFDTKGLGEGCEVPLGILDLSGLSTAHPTEDPNIVESLPTKEARTTAPSPPQTEHEPAGVGGQTREPFLFGQVLKALGMKLDSHEAAVKFYREKALPHLIPFPKQEHGFSSEPLMEGLEPWDVGNATEEIDWLESVMLSPVVVPGMTTLKRTWGVMGGNQREKTPLDLDLYVDCSGSIPNPQTALSYLTLAGAIVVLSAMRTGARVQATLWSGPGEFDKTCGFVSDERAVLRVLTGYLGGSTAFPNHIFRETYQGRNESTRPVHILILSDEGVDTMQNQDEKGNPGLEISQMALERARGGGTMVLNLYRKEFLERPFGQAVARMGWELFRVTDWSELLQFAREFARLKYGRSRKRR